MKAKYWLIQGTDHDDETGKPLYWSNKLGWVDKDSATRFNTRQMHNSDTAPLYMGGAAGWILEERAE